MADPTGAAGAGGGRRGVRRDDADLRSPCGSFLFLLHSTVKRFESDPFLQQLTVTT